MAAPDRNYDLKKKITVTELHFILLVNLKCVDSRKSKTVLNSKRSFCHPFGLRCAGRLHHSPDSSYATALGCFSALHRTCHSQACYVSRNNSVRVTPIRNNDTNYCLQWLCKPFAVALCAMGLSRNVFSLRFDGIITNNLNDNLNSKPVF
jgi:hypothetical protein